MNCITDFRTHIYLFPILTIIHHKLWSLFISFQSTLGGDKYDFSSSFLVPLSLSVSTLGGEIDPLWVGIRLLDQTFAKIITSQNEKKWDILFYFSNILNSTSWSLYMRIISKYRQDAVKRTVTPSAELQFRNFYLWILLVELCTIGHHSYHVFANVNCLSRRQSLPTCLQTSGGLISLPN